MAKTQQELLEEADAQKQTAQIPQFDSAADLDRYWTGLRMQEEEQNREREEKRAQRQLAARSLSDLGQSFVDMIKASEGAIVSPRSVEQQYNALDDRQRQLTDNYRARMDALRQGYLDRTKAREDADAKREADKYALQANLAFKANEGRLNRDMKERVARNRYSGKVDDKYYLDFGGGLTKSYTGNTKEGMNKFASIYTYLLQNNLIPDEFMRIDQNGNFLPPRTQADLDVIVRASIDGAMENPYVRADIIDIVYGKGNSYSAQIRANADAYAQKINGLATKIGGYGISTGGSTQQVGQTSTEEPTNKIKVNW